MRKMLILCCFSITVHYCISQDMSPISPLEHVSDPFDTKHLAQHFVRTDSLHNGYIRLDYGYLFAMDELNMLGLQSAFKIKGHWSGILNARFLSWGPYTQFFSNTGFIASMPALYSTLMVDLKTRYISITPVFLQTAFQVNAHGLIYLQDDFYLFWSIQDLFEWNTAGPVQGQSVLGVHLDILPELYLNMGLEQNYLYQMDSWVSLGGKILKPLTIGFSYLSLEQELSFFTKIKMTTFSFEVGASYHSILGLSYRSSVLLYY